MNKPLTTEHVGNQLRHESKGKLTIQECYLTVQDILHILLENEAGDTIDFSVDPLAPSILIKCNKPLSRYEELEVDTLPMLELKKLIVEEELSIDLDKIKKVADIRAIIKEQLES